MEVHPSLPVMTVAEFIAYAKANPGKIALASAGVGTRPHVVRRIFQDVTGVDCCTSPIAARAGGDRSAWRAVPVFHHDRRRSIGHIRAGRLRALAVTTATRRRLCRTFRRSAKPAGLRSDRLAGIVAPKDTPAGMVKSSTGRSTRARRPKMKARFASSAAR